MSENYTVLSPWSNADVDEQIGLAPRLSTLNGKIIGLFANFKGHSALILKELSRLIAQQWPDVHFTSFEYPFADEIAENEQWLGKYRAWLAGCDGLISAYGDDGSSTMYHGMNTALAERLGVPTVIVAKSDVSGNAVRGAAMRMVPNLRCVTAEIPDLSLYPRDCFDEIISSNTGSVVGKVTEALMQPLSQDEAEPPPSSSARYANEIFTGSYEELNKRFYLLGFTNGTPIVPPTRSAVENMLRGTDLPGDTVLGILPPKRGILTVEKLAVNAVMAGCLPTYFPILIAMARAFSDPRISVMGWMCSVAGFAPMIIVNGPVRRDIDLNCTENVLSPYFLPNTSIARALSLITLNIAGIRPTQEDRAYGGHEARGGVCFGEDEEHSPWEPYHVTQGFAPEDSTVTLVWFQNRSMIKGSSDAVSNMKILCGTDDIGFAPGATFVISHTFAETLSNAGFTKRQVLEYITEYARKPASEAPLRWLRENNHLPESAPLPMDGSFSVRKYWDINKLRIIVSTSGAMPRGCAMLGGGDHGGPVTKKIDLPRNWLKLVDEYKEYGSVSYV